MPAFGTTGKTERCVICGDKWSANGDFPACSQQCAAEAFARIVIGAEAYGLDWKDLLPRDQRPDLVPWDAWQAGTRLNGKKHWRKVKTEEATHGVDREAQGRLPGTARDR